MQKHSAALHSVVLEDTQQQWNLTFVFVCVTFRPPHRSIPHGECLRNILRTRFCSPSSGIFVALFESTAWKEWQETGWEREMTCSKRPQVRFKMGYTLFKLSYQGALSQNVLIWSFFLDLCASSWLTRLRLSLFLVWLTGFLTLFLPARTKPVGAVWQGCQQK